MAIASLSVALTIGGADGGAGGKGLALEGSPVAPASMKLAPGGSWRVHPLASPGVMDGGWKSCCGMDRRKSLFPGCKAGTCRNEVTLQRPLGRAAQSVSIRWQSHEPREPAPLLEEQWAAGTSPGCQSWKDPWLPSPGTHCSPCWVHQKHMENPAHHDVCLPEHWD